MKDFDYDEPSYDERQSNPWRLTSEQWFQRQAAEFDAEMQRQRIKYPNSVLKKIRIELRKHIKPRDIAKMSESEYAIYLAEAREQIRRKYSKKRVDPSDKPGKSSGYQTKAGGRL